MPILNASEFEAVLSTVRSRIERAISERGTTPVLETTIRDVGRLYQAARKPGALKPLRGLMEQLTETLEREIAGDNALLEHLWDLGDYIDYRG